MNCTPAISFLPEPQPGLAPLSQAMRSNARLRSWEPSVSASVRSCIRDCREYRETHGPCSRILTNRSQFAILGQAFGGRGRLISSRSVHFTGIAAGGGTAVRLHERPGADSAFEKSRQPSLDDGESMLRR